MTRLALSRRPRAKRLTLALLICLTAAANTAPAATRVPIGTHIPLKNPFIMPQAQWDALFIGTTPGGKALSAQQLSPLVLHSEWPTNTFYTGGNNWDLKIGVFLLHVRGDGAVSSIGILQRIGRPQLDNATVRAFSKWRFRPNSVKEVRVPAYFTRIN